MEMVGWVNAMHAIPKDNCKDQGKPVSRPTNTRPGTRPGQVADVQSKCRAQLLYPGLREHACGLGRPARQLLSWLAAGPQ